MLLNSNEYGKSSSSSCISLLKSRDPQNYAVKIKDLPTQDLESTFESVIDLTQVDTTKTMDTRLIKR